MFSWKIPLRPSTHQCWIQLCLFFYYPINTKRTESKYAAFHDCYSTLRSWNLLENCFKARKNCKVRFLCKLWIHSFCQGFIIYFLSFYSWVFIYYGFYSYAGFCFSPIPVGMLHLNVRFINQVEADIADVQWGCWWEFGMAWLVDQ